MKKTVLLFAILSLSLVFVSCKHQKEQSIKHISTVTLDESMRGIHDAQLYKWTWEGGKALSKRYDNVYDPFFSHDMHYTYEDGRIVKVSDEHYFTTFTYNGTHVAQLDQFSYTGVHVARATLEDQGNGRMKVRFERLSSAAMKWVESCVFERKDTLGNVIRVEKPADTSLHENSVADLVWKDGNLVSAKVDYFVDGFSIDTQMEYDDKVNPFYGLYTEFTNLDYAYVTMSHCDNTTGLSKNNTTRVISVMEGPLGKQVDTLNYSYTYSGNYPTSMKNAQNTMVLHFNYLP